MRGRGPRRARDTPWRSLPAPPRSGACRASPRRAPRSAPPATPTGRASRRRRGSTGCGGLRPCGLRLSARSRRPGRAASPRRRGRTWEEGRRCERNPPRSGSASARGVSPRRTAGDGNRTTPRWRSRIRGRTSRPCRRRFPRRRRRSARCSSARGRRRAGCPAHAGRATGGRRSDGEWRTGPGG